ncbi:hypothetical protein AURANDRAFT_65768, partial [Aureococcus anophagefferens]
MSTSCATSPPRCPRRAARRRAGDGRSVSYADGVFPADGRRRAADPRRPPPGSPRRSQPQPWFARRASPRRPASAPTWRDDGAADRRRPASPRAAPRWRDGDGGDDDPDKTFFELSLSPARNARRSPRRRARFAEPPSRDRTPSPKPAAALEAWDVTSDRRSRGRLPAAASPPRHAGAGAPPVFGAPGPDDHLFAGAPPPAAKRATARGFDDTWACPVCFYGDNKKGADACTICRSPNPASADAVVYVTCPACGHHNRRFGEDQKCEICDLELMSSRSARALASSVAKPERAVPWTRPDPKDHGGWRGLDESDDDDDAYPRAPPCCYGCGWNSTIVSDGWNHDGRRVVGISKDDWVMGPTLKCKTCERKCNARRSRAPEEKKEDKEFMKVFMKGYRYKFESYSVESVRLYEEKYPGFMAKQDFVITTRRTAMTRTLADIVRPLVNSGMNPNNISNLLAETKDLALTRSLLNATGAISDATAPGQHTLATALNRANLGNFVDEVMKFQTCSPGHKLVRRFVVDASEAVCHSQFSFREKKVGGAIIAIDHTLKTLKGQKVAQEKVSKNRLT